MPNEASGTGPALGAPRCSVIIPAYNAEDFVARAVQSALEQVPRPDIVVVDDGSNDATAAVVEAIGRDVTLIRQENSGRSTARMVGFSRSDTEFVIFLDADDELLPGAVATHLEAMEKHVDAAMVFGSNYRIDEEGVRLDANPQSFLKTTDPEYVAYCVTPTPSQCMYRRNAVLAVDGFDPELELCEDPDLNIRILVEGAIVCHGEFVANYRMHKGQSTKRPSKICRAHLNVIRRHLGPGGTFHHAAGLSRCETKWKRYYGQNIPVEVVRTALRRDFSGSWAAFITFMYCLPHSAVGAAKQAPVLLRRRLV